MSSRKKYFVIYDNLCLFCNNAKRLIELLDWFSLIKTVPIYDAEELKRSELPIVPQEDLLKEMHLISKGGAVLKGFYACRKIGLLLPLTFPLALFLFIPGIALLGEKIYSYIANNRSF